MEIQANRATFKSYLLFWIGQLASLLGSSISQFVIIWWITLETKSALYLSIASLLGLAPLVVLGPFTGVLVDRWNRKTLIGIVDFLQALTTAILIFLFWSGNVLIWQILVLLTLKGIFQAFHAPATMAVIPLMVPEDRLSRINGLNYLSNGAVNLIGPVVAAFLLEFWEISQILWIDVGTFLVALIPLLIIMMPFVGKKQKSSFTKEFAEGFSFIKNRRGVLPLILLATALNFLAMPLITLLPYYVKFDHFGDASDLALVMAFMQGGILAGGVLMSVIKGFKKKLVVSMSSLYIQNLGYALMALTPIGLFWFMGTMGLVMYFTLPIVDVSIITILQTVVPKEMQGRVISVVMSLASAAQPLGIVLSGATAGLTGTANLFLGCAGLGMVISTLSWLFTDIRYVEKMGEPQTTNVALTTD